MGEGQKIDTYDHGLLRQRQARSCAHENSNYLRRQTLPDRWQNEKIPDESMPSDQRQAG